MTPPSEPLYSDIMKQQSGIPVPHKVCIKCHIDKPLHEFPARKGSADEHRNDCQRCRNAYQLHRKEFGRTRISTALLPPPPTKLCNKCLVEQPSANFSKKPKGKYGLSPTCRRCCASRCKQWRDTHPDRSTQSHKRYYENNRDRVIEVSTGYNRRNAAQRTVYLKEWRQMNSESCKAHDKKKRFSAVGVDENWYNDKLASQGGKCEICGKSADFT